MKHPLITLALIFSVFLFSSCDAIASIFQAGMTVGVIMVIAIVAIIIFVISRFTKK